VYARGNDKRLIYRDDEDRRTYLRMLASTVGKRRWRLFAFCLMENHLHLLLQTPEPNLGVGVQRLHSDYAQGFNRRHRRSGHLFQGRYGAVRVVTDEQLWTVAAYVALNPVRAGLCERPEEWRWSSYGIVIDGRQPSWLDSQGLLDHFGAAGGDPVERYVAMVAG
jgi:REP element-mobilizing transposase RayT